MLTKTTRTSKHNLDARESFLKRLEHRSCKDFKHLDNFLGSVRSNAQQSEDDYPATFDILRLTFDIKLQTKDNNKTITIPEEWKPSPIKNKETDEVG